MRTIFVQSVSQLLTSDFLWVMSGIAANKIKRLYNNYYNVQNDKPIKEGVVFFSLCFFILNGKIQQQKKYIEQKELATGRGYQRSMELPLHNHHCDAKICFHLYH